MNHDLSDRLSVVLRGHPEATDLTARARFIEDLCTSHETMIETLHRLNQTLTKNRGGTA